MSEKAVIETLRKHDSEDGVQELGLLIRGRSNQIMEGIQYVETLLSFRESGRICRYSVPRFGKE